MIELYDKLDNLKVSLDNNEIVIKIKKQQEIVYKNKELIKLIEDYKLHGSESLKRRIYDFEEFREYKRLENELAFLILDINKRLKTIQEGRRCG